MKTSQQWWQEVKADSAKINDWLVKQYRGEVTAAKRILEILEKFEVTTKAKRILVEIAGQEETHAKWIKALLDRRGIEASEEGAEERYWKEVKPAQVDFETTAAIGAHAEKMRLERINAIVADPSSPPDIRCTFAAIQKQEYWHMQAFAKLAGDDALARTKYTHEKGRALLGLVP